MADKSTQEMICAFAAGCMDQKNYAHFKEYMISRNDLPYSELGEMQNIMAMIPIILEVEKPDSELKKRVAKKLIEITDEIKEKKLSNKNRTREEDKPSRTSVRDSEKDSHPTPRITLVGKDRSEDDLLIKKARSEDADLFKTPITKNISNSEERVPVMSPEKKKSSKLPYILFIVILVLFGGAVYYFQTENNALETRLGEIKVNLESIQQSYSSSQRFINNYMSLIEFFHYNDIVVVNFERSDSTRASGKLFLSFEEREALIQVSDLPPISPDEVFELWFVSKGVSMSMGVFIPIQNQTYIKVPTFPTVSREEISQFSVTIEPAAGSDTPTGSTVFTGSFTDVKVPAQTPQRRRLW